MFLSTRNNKHLRHKHLNGRSFLNINKHWGFSFKSRESSTKRPYPSRRFINSVRSLYKTRLSFVSMRENKAESVAFARRKSVRWITVKKSIKRVKTPTQGTNIAGVHITTSWHITRIHVLPILHEISLLCTQPNQSKYVLNITTTGIQVTIT